METRNDVDVALKFGNDMPSFASMVMAFMVMSLQIFANLQKANMDMALNQLNLVVTDMKRQIAEMEAEKESTFKKDMIMAGLEVASAVVQFVGSAVTVYQLKGKITEQGDIYNSEKASSLQAKTEKTIAETSTKVNRASDQAHQGGLDAQLQSKTNNRIEAARSDLNNVKTEKANADSTLGVPDTPEGFNQKYNKIKSEVDYINTRQHAIAGASALMKAFSPLVQGLLGSEATTHQIGAKSSENAKEIRNSVYRQHMEWAAAIRDAINRVLAMLQEVQRQDPENAMAISKKMA
jgi:hypothetical protein